MIGAQKTVEVIKSIFVNANPIHQRPRKMAGRTHRSNCRQGLRELFVMHTEQPLTGFVYVGWNKMIEKIKDQRAGLAGSEGLGSTEQDVLEGRVLGKLPKAWGSSPHEWAAGGGKEISPCLARSMLAIDLRKDKGAFSFC